MKKFMILLGLMLLFPSLLLAQSGSSQYNPDSEEVSTDFSPVVVGLDLSLEPFRYSALNSGGFNYSLGLGLYGVNSWSLYSRLHYISGQKSGKAVNELGNPSIGFEWNVLEVSRLQTWILGEARFARYDSDLSAKYNTFIPGMSFRTQWSRWSGALSLRYFHRTTEQDPLLDVMDITQGDLSAAYKFNFGQLGGMIYTYRTEGIRRDGISFVRPLQWVGFGPTYRYRMNGNTSFRTSLLFPYSVNRDEQEATLAVWDTELPKAREITWKADVGVSF